MSKKPRRSGWPTWTDPKTGDAGPLRRERDAREAAGLPIPSKMTPEDRKGYWESHRDRMIATFQKYGFTRDEAEGLVVDESLRASSLMGRLFARQRKKEVEYYMVELGDSWNDAVQRASELRAIIVSAPRTISPQGVLGEALKWSTRFVKKRIVWEKGDTDASVEERFDKYYTPAGRNVEDYY